MVEAAGIEPAAIENPRSSKAGRHEAHPGQNSAQVGHPSRVTPDPQCKSRTEQVAKVVHPGHSRNTISTQRRETTKPMAGESGLDPTSLSADLQTIVNVWPRLPRAIQEGILAMVRAVAR